MLLRIVEAQCELLHPDGWGFLRVLRTREGNFRFTFGCVPQIIPWGWSVHLAFCDRKPWLPASHDTDSPNAIILLPSRLPALVSNCTNPGSQGRLVCHPTGSLVSLPSSRYSSQLFYAKNYIKLAAFIPQLSQRDFPPHKLKALLIY
jgi:hypothetical protein